MNVQLDQNRRVPVHKDLTVTGLAPGSLKGALDVGHEERDAKALKALPYSTHQTVPIILPFLIAVRAVLRSPTRKMRRLGYRSFEIAQKFGDRIYAREKELIASTRTRNIE